MRRRLIVAMVGTVVAALVLTGLGTLALARLGASRYAERELRSEVEVIADTLSTDTVLFELRDRPRVLAALRDALRLEGVDLVTVGLDGQIEGTLPEGITLSAADTRALQEGETVSGRERPLVYAAAAVNRADARIVVVLSDRTDIPLGGIVGWFLLAAVIVAALGAMVATRLSGTLTKPLRDAEAASRRLAAGDLTARVAEPAAGARDEVADLSRSINAMAEALERSRGLEQQFLLSVSHDLRTPLTSIRGYAEAMADGTGLPAEHAGTVILSESRRLERLVRDLLELAHLDARSFSLRSDVVELDDLVAACVDGFAPEAAAAGVAITVRAVPSVVHGDHDRLAQVVANLLENGLKYASSVLVVRVASDDGRARVSVDDDGPGIAPVDLPHVFDRLYVARHQPERRESASGLGLAIVRELVAAMGGTAGAEPSPTGGARLWIELPAQVHQPEPR